MLMIIYPDSSTTANTSIFNYSENDTTANDQNAGIYCSSEKIEEDDLWMIIDRRKWLDYLKSLWREVSRERQCLNLLEYAGHKLYYRRLGMSISGWIARAGFKKKRN